MQEPPSRSVPPSKKELKEEKKKAGGSLSAYLSSFRQYQPIEWIRTGIPAIDLVIGNGIPLGRFIEVLGEHSTAKSAFGYCVIAAFQRAGAECMLIDSEAKADKSFIERLGVDWSKLHYSAGETLKSCVHILGKIAKLADPKKPVLVVWDSIASTPGAWEMGEHMDEKKDFTGEKASRARFLSAAFRAVLGELARKQVTIIAINQLRTKFNFMGHSSMETPGGKAPKYHSGVRIRMREKGKIKHKATDVVTGIQLEVEAIKNTVAPPFRKCYVKFYFETGFAAYSGLDELLLRHGRIHQKAGWLQFGEKTFRGGEIERLISEMPGLIDPLSGTLDSVSPGLDLSSDGDNPEEVPKEPESETAATEQ